MPQNNKSGTIRFTVQPREIDAVTIQSISNPFQSNFESQIFTPATPKATNIGYYDYPVYFYYYFRMAFFLCLVHFWVDSNNKTTLKLVTFKLQRVLCATVHVGSLVALVLWFRFYVNKSTKKHPDKIFEMARCIFYSFYILAYAKVVWSRKIYSLLERIPPTRTQKVILNWNTYFKHKDFVNFAQ